ncbi:uncharacterized protein LOC141648526 [Silene latifolia]|uniref:uncharacterized protein LOC141648526 n=1 Tax=Silene latifolia TaxID=37657 RepID=UPI003D775F64
MGAICQGSSARLEEILESDDGARLVNLFRDHPADLETINSLVNECVESGASKCLIALIRGQVCNIHPTFNTENLPDSGMTALAYVAHSCPDPEVINLMLTKCGGACLANLGCTIGLAHGLPIHFLLVNLSIMDHLFLWYRGTSLLKLIILLCHWKTKPILDSLRVLVKYTDSINDIAWTMLKNGGLRQFTALLLIAREKVIAPFDTGLTIHAYITAEIDSFPEGELDNEQEEHKCIFMDARTLLTIFEITGDDLSSYCSSMYKSVPIEEVMSDVSNLLIKNQVLVAYHDTDLAECWEDGGWGNPLVMHFECAHQNPTFTAESAVHPSDPSNYHIDMWRCKRETSMPIPKHACLQQRLYTTGACQARKISKSSLHTGVGPLPQHLGFITRKFINRVRFL